MPQPGGNPGEASTSNFATIKTTSIVSKQQKEHLHEDMHAALSGYKRMRQEHLRALAKVISKILFSSELDPTAKLIGFVYIYVS